MSRTPHFSGRRRLVTWLLAALAVVGVGTTPGAHTVPIEPVVTVNLRPDSGPEGERLTVRVVVPIAGLADAELPRTAARRLQRPAADEILRLVAREVASALSVAQNDYALEPPASTVTIAPDDSQVEFVLTYTLRSPRAPLSARLHTFPAVPRPLAMVATFDAPGERPRTFTVSGAPERIVFEPGAATVAYTFAARAGRMLFEHIDALLMLLCLAVGLSSRTHLKWAVAALTVAHAAGFVVGAGSLAPLTREPSPIVGAVGASVVVAAAAGLVVGAGPVSVTVLALLFGALNGASLGEQLRIQSSFAGAHPYVAVGAAAAVTTIGQIWIVAVLATIVGIARARGMTDRLLRYAGAAWTGHTALHLIADRTIVPEGTESWWLTRLEMLILLSWVAALVMLAAIRAVRGRVATPSQS